MVTCQGGRKKVLYQCSNGFVGSVRVMATSVVSKDTWTMGDCVDSVGGFSEDTEWKSDV